MNKKEKDEWNSKILEYDSILKKIKTKHKTEAEKKEHTTIGFKEESLVIIESIINDIKIINDINLININIAEKTNKTLLTAQNNYQELLENINRFFIKLEEYLKILEEGYNKFNIQEIERQLSSLNNKTIQLNSIIDEFKEYSKLEFFQKNIVIIGANGSGKTFYSLKLAKYFGDVGVLISGQKSLNPKLITGINYDSENQFDINVSKNRSLSKEPGSDFATDKKMSIMITQLILSHFKASHSAREGQKDKVGKEIQETNLEKVIKTWNELIKTRELFFNSENIVSKIPKTDNTYALHSMSEGEKTLLYYIGIVILAPKDGFIIIDEPESFLHKAIIEKLWDKLETIRKDCKFIYITHNLEFAESRKNFLKLWIKNFIFPLEWELEKIKNNEIPEKLYYEILGSKQPILFCEGNANDSFDRKILEILFGDKFLIKDVESCNNVISYTKVFNNLKFNKEKAFGLVDRDFRSEEEILSYEKEGIFFLEVAEIENLLCDEILLEKLYMLINGIQDVNDLEIKDKINQLKGRIIKKFSQDIDAQTTKFIKEELQYLLLNEKIHQEKKLEELQAKIELYKNKIKSFELEAKFNTQKIKLQEIIDTNNYDECLKYYNNKGLYHGEVKLFFGKKDLETPLFNLLRYDLECKEQLLKKFPDKLVEKYREIDSL